MRTSWKRTLAAAVVLGSAFVVWADDLTVAGNLFVTGTEEILGGSSRVAPYWGYDLQNNRAVFVRQSSSTSSNVPYSGFVFSNNQTGVDNNIAQLMFINEAVAGLEKRVAQILVRTNGAPNAGRIIFRTYNSLGGVEALTLWNDGKASFARDVNTQGNFTAAGEVSANVIEVRGADMSELFDVKEKADIAKPGMVVCIDPDNPGGLMLNRKAYDKCVAGVLSGAGGINAGMVMGQKGTLAYGNCPVALNGRVYCYVDATKDAVEPGDLLTTSTVPGYAMKVIDHATAQGAIIGKAMTPLGKGKQGLVLILVTLQ